MANLFWLSGRTYTDATGVPYALAKAYFYDTGTLAAKDTYTAVGLGTPNANPVVAGSDGVFPDIYFAAGRYKCIIKTAADATLRTFDPIDSEFQFVTSATTPSPTYPFMGWYDSVGLHKWRRNAADSAWIDEGPVDSVGSAASVTDVLTGTSVAVFATPDALAGLWQRGSAITPSAGSVALPSTGGTVFAINAGNFSSIGTAYGGRCLKFNFVGASVITHNASSMILPGAANITTVAGDCAEFVNEAATDVSGTNWRCTKFTRASGSPINLTDNIAAQAAMETPTSTTLVSSVNNMKYHPGVVKAYVQFDASSTVPIAGSPSLNHSSFTDNGVGDFTMNFTTSFSAATYAPAGVAQRTTVNSGAMLGVKQGVAPTVSAFRFMTVDDAAGAMDVTFGALHITGDFA